MRRIWKYIAIVQYALWLVAVERFFFKGNASFSLGFLYSSLPNNPSWDLPALTSEQGQQLDEILAQPFTYFAKGTHCYAFASEDGKYVLKFHRYPSHMRLFSWLKSPLAYRLDPRRIQIKEHNVARHAEIMENYKASFSDLKEETGVILLHINCTEHLKKTATLIDKAKNRYSLPLDDVTFILQHKAKLIFPALESYFASGQTERTKESLQHIVQLIVNSWQKGYLNKDPVLKKNYGLLANRAIYIDTGDLKQEKVKDMESHLAEVTAPLRQWLQEHSFDLCEYFYSLCKNSLNCVCKEEGTTSSMPPRSYIKK
ncbi:MAG TPA: hypothetical protein VGJ00_09070 [Rhabdochlamydiaceae bacterium]